MALRYDRFACYPQQKTSATTCTMEEGVKPDERSRTESTTASTTPTNAPQVIATYTLPLPPDNILKAGVYQCTLRWWGTSGTVKGKARLAVDGSTNFDSAEATLTNSESDQTFDITVASDTYIASTLTLQLVATTNNEHNFKPVHDNVVFGVKAGEAGCSRHTAVLTPLAPLSTAHSSPVSVDGLPQFSLEATYLYATDDIYLNKLADTLKTASHSASGTTTQTVGAVVDYTDSLTGLSTRRISFTADATRKPDALTNTFYSAAVYDTASAFSVGSMAYELRLIAEQAMLTSLNGSSGSPVITTDLEPVLHWTDVNTTTTHWRVKVYRASDDTEMWDSTETAVGVSQVTIPAAAELVSLTTYYAVVTVMKGSGGSSWSVDSERGYFQIDKTSTAVKITSHEGTSDTPEIITDATPEITWTFAKTQHSFNLVAVDTSDQSIAYASGWTVSATKSHTIPSGLSAGGTYTIQLSVKDAGEQHIYTPDKRAWVHINDASVAAPTLTGEADCTTLDLVTLEWSAPATTDSDTLSYTVELTTPSGSATTIVTHVAGANTSIALGRIKAGTYSWRVQATDEHGMAGSWSSADEFVVTQTGTVPVCTLTPLATGTDTTPLHSWTTTDVDGDAQTDFEVELYSDAYSTKVYDSGTQTSTNMYFEHPAALTAGTYYRQVRVRTASTDWSEWAQDSFVIVAATSQTADWNIYLDAEGTPTEIDYATYPVSGLTVSRRLDGPTEFSFQLNNFDGLEGGIDDDEEIILYLKDTSGNRVEFRGFVQEKALGDMCEVRCADIAAKFRGWKCTILTDHKTLGEIIRMMVANPTGSAATGIVCHVDECEDPETAGQPIVFAEFDGQGRTVGEWLAEFQKLTGFRWYVECISGTWHFWWFDPDSVPTWAITLKDNIDYGAESTSQWLVLPGAKVTKSRMEYANRIRYWAKYEPLALPPGYSNWDEVFTESATGWTAYDGVSVAAEGTEKKAGSNSVKLSYTFTGPGEVPLAIPLAYVAVPASYGNFNNPAYGDIALQAALQGTFTTERYDSWGGHGWGSAGWLGRITLACYLHSDGRHLSTQGLLLDGTMLQGSYHMGNPVGVSTAWQSCFYRIHGYLDYADQIGNSGATTFRQSNVTAISFWAYIHNGPDAWETDYCKSLEAGESFTMDWYLDSWMFRSPLAKGGPSLGQFYVEAAAVAAGTEVPIEAEIADTGLTQNEARALALKWLDIKSRTKTTVSSLTIPGIRNVPMRVDVPVALANGPVHSDTYPLAAVTWKPADSGWMTEITLGDMPSDVSRSLEALGRGYKRLTAEAQVR